MMADTKSTRTKMLEETKVDENEDFMTRTIRKGMRGAAIGASRLADKLGFTQEDVYKDKTKEELEVKKAAGGMLKDVDAESNPGLAKLPEPVRNKMGYKRSGGSVKYKSGGKVGSASKRADGCAQRGKTRGKMV